MQGRHIALATLAVLGLAPVATASIMTLELSTHSSDMTPAEDLNATVDFSVVGLTLTISITNDTQMTGEYNINQFYFNGPDGVSLAEDSFPVQWNLDAAGGIMVDGFGKFDFGLTNGTGETHPSLINPGETLVFTFTMSAPANVKDFTTEFSIEDPPGATPMIIAAKFVNGPGDDSAYGGTVPTPGVLALMAMAGLVAARPKRRRD